MNHPICLFTMTQPRILNKNNIHSSNSINCSLHKRTLPCNQNNYHASKRLNPSMAFSLDLNSLEPGNKYFRRFLNLGNQGRN